MTWGRKDLYALSTVALKNYRALKVKVETITVGGIANMRCPPYMEDIKRLLFSILVLSLIY